MDNIDFEVIIITYNQEDLILNALESVIKQTYKPSLISIFDDCSVDNTYQLLNEKVKEYPGNIKLHKNETNLGIFNNFNQAFTQASGEVICLLSGDDEYELDLLENYVKYIRSHCIDLNHSFWIIPNIRLLYPNEKVIDVYQSRYTDLSAFELILTGKVRSFEVGLSRSVANQSIIRTDCGYQADLLKSLLLTKIVDIHFADFFGYRYRISTGVTTNSNQKKILKSRCLILTCLLEEYESLFTLEERRLISYELALVHLKINPSILVYWQLLVLSVEVLQNKRNVYGYKRLFLNLIPMNWKMNIKSIFNKNQSL
ncbi:glycosyltransferase family 2 protein [Bacteroides sp.]